jgi:Fe-S-cluster containining protein
MKHPEQVEARAGEMVRRPTELSPMIDDASEYHWQVVESERQLATAALARERSPAAVYEVVDDAVSLASAFMRSGPAAPPSLGCKRGCAHCCHRPVGASPPVVLRIAAALRQGASKAEFADALARVCAPDKTTRDADSRPSVHPPQPCVFLVDGACSIYAIRPFVCRAWNSVDPEACRQTLGEDSVDMRFDLLQRTTFASIETGLQFAFESSGLDAAALEFTAAMRIAMAIPNACERWLAGEAIFSGCEAKRDSRRRLPLV